jgi:hypothetical protein
VLLLLGGQRKAQSNALAWVVNDRWEASQEVAADDTRGVEGNVQAPHGSVHAPHLQATGYINVAPDGLSIQEGVAISH